jgi:hypothetical protein
MKSPEVFCALDSANDSNDTERLFACGPCGVRARQDQSGIVEVITKNVCQRLLLDASASGENGNRQLELARRPEFTI